MDMLYSVLLCFLFLTIVQQSSKKKMDMLYSVLLCFLFLTIIPIKIILQTRSKQHKILPPSPLALPIIGHLHLLTRQIHRALHELSQKYGPIMALRFGSQLVIVVSSLSVAEECFTKNDILFADRPRFLMGKYLQYDFTTLAAANYGDHWRNLRRIATLEILSETRLHSFLNVRRDEVRILLRRLDRVGNRGFGQVNLRTMFLDLTSNIIMRMVAGKRYYGEEVSNEEEAKKCREIVDEFFELSGTAHVSDFFPILQVVDYDGYVKKMERMGKKMDGFLQGLVDEHRVDKGRNTMINHLLNFQEAQPEYYSDEIIKGLILIMVLAGSETTATALEWAVANLLNNPKVLERVKAELDSQIGLQDHLIDETDFSKLHYLQCVISENLRLCPITPIIPPHMSSEECVLGGYHIPRGTTLFVNSWAIHRDPELWEDPTSFKPERFENGKSGASKLIFGRGRRSCPGEGLAHRVMGSTLGALIQCFDWKRVGEEDIDMTEKVGITMTKVEPLMALCRTRPNAHNFF